MSDENLNDDNKVVEKKKSSKTWNIIWVAALVIFGVKRFKEKRVLNGPHAKQVKEYQDFQSDVASKRFSFVQLRETPPKTITEQDNFNKKLKKECSEFPQPTYKFQDEIYASMLNLCKTMYSYQTYVHNAFKKGVPEEQIGIEMDKYLKKLVSYEDYLMDGMDNYPSNTKLAKGLKNNQYAQSELKNSIENTVNNSKNDHGKLRNWVKGQQLVFKGLVRSVIEQDQSMFDRFHKQHHKGCKLIVKNKALNSEIDTYCKKSTLAVREIASLENRKKSVHKVNQIVEDSLKPLENIVKIIKSSK